MNIIYKGDIVKINTIRMRRHLTGVKQIAFLKKHKITGRTHGVVVDCIGAGNQIVKVKFPKYKSLYSMFSMDLKLVQASSRHPLTNIFL